MRPIQQDIRARYKQFVENKQPTDISTEIMSGQSLSVFDILDHIANNKFLWPKNTDVSCSIIGLNENSTEEGLMLWQKQIAALCSDISQDHKYLSQIVNHSPHQELAIEHVENKLNLDFKRLVKSANMPEHSLTIASMLKIYEHLLSLLKNLMAQDISSQEILTQNIAQIQKATCSFVEQHTRQEISKIIHRIQSAPTMQWKKLIEDVCMKINHDQQRITNALNTSNNQFWRGTEIIWPEALINRCSKQSLIQVCEHLKNSLFRIAFLSEMRTMRSPQICKDALKEISKELASADNLNLKSISEHIYSSCDTYVTKILKTWDDIKNNKEKDITPNQIAIALIELMPFAKSADKILSTIKEIQYAQNNPKDMPFTVSIEVSGTSTYDYVQSLHRIAVSLDQTDHPPIVLMYRDFVSAALESNANLFELRSEVLQMEQGIDTELQSLHIGDIKKMIELHNADHLKYEAFLAGISDKILRIQNSISNKQKTPEEQKQFEEDLRTVAAHSPAWLDIDEPLEEKCSRIILHLEQNHRSILLRELERAKSTKYINEAHAYIKQLFNASQEERINGCKQLIKALHHIDLTYCVDQFISLKKQITFLLQSYQNQSNICPNDEIEKLEKLVARIIPYSYQNNKQIIDDNITVDKQLIILQNMVPHVTYKGIILLLQDASKAQQSVAQAFYACHAIRCSFEYDSDFKHLLACHNELIKLYQEIDRIIQWFCSREKDLDVKGFLNNYASQLMRRNKEEMITYLASGFSYNTWYNAWIAQSINTVCALFTEEVALKQDKQQLQELFDLQAHSIYMNFMLAINKKQPIEAGKEFSSYLQLNKMLYPKYKLNTARNIPM